MMNFENEVLLKLRNSTRVLPDTRIGPNKCKDYQAMASREHSFSGVGQRLIKFRASIFIKGLAC